MSAGRPASPAEGLDGKTGVNSNPKGNRRRRRENAFDAAVASRAAVQAANAAPLSDGERRVFATVLLLTVGYGKLEDRTTAAEVSRESHVHERTARAALKRLDELGIVCVESKRGRGVGGITVRLPEPGDDGELAEETSEKTGRLRGPVIETGRPRDPVRAENRAENRFENRASRTPDTELTEITDSGPASQVRSSLRSRARADGPGDAPEREACELDDEMWSTDVFDIATSTRSGDPPTDVCVWCGRHVPVGHLIDFLCERCNEDGEEVECEESAQPLVAADTGRSPATTRRRR